MIIFGLFLSIAFTMVVFDFGVNALDFTYVAVVVIVVFSGFCFIFWLFLVLCRCKLMFFKFIEFFNVFCFVVFMSLGILWMVWLNFVMVFIRVIIFCLFKEDFKRFLGKSKIFNVELRFKSWSLLWSLYFWYEM